MAETVHKDTQRVKTHESSRSSGIANYSLFAESENGTAIVVKKIPIAELEGVYLRVKGLALRDTAAEALRTEATHLFRRAASGNVTAVGSASIVTANDSSGTPTITLVANTTDQTVDITVTGEASKDFAWGIDVQEMKISF